MNNQTTPAQDANPVTPQTLSDAERVRGECLKEQINLLLWRWLPDTATLSEADAVACDICVRIQDEWNKIL